MKLNWSVPNRKSGRPFTAADIDHYGLSMQVEGAPSFTPINPPAPADAEYTLDVSDPGTYTFRLVCFPKVGNTSDPATASGTIADVSAPVIVDFTVTV